MFSHDLINEAVAWRRDLHQNPELGFEECRTSGIIGKLLNGWGWKVYPGLAGTGIVATMGEGNKSIGIRADIDALPIEEKTGLDYSSRNKGKMHACGHDGHTAMLLLAARKISENGVERGTVTLIFQPAEENEGGARMMIEDGLFDRFPVTAVFGIHNWPSLPIGKLVARDDNMMAAFAVFEIKISGRGGHAAMPEQSDGVIAAASQISDLLQTIPARALSPVEPAVVSVTQIHTGSAFNVSPDEAVVRGTARWFSREAGDTIEARLKQITNALSQSQGCDVTIEFQRRYPATVNNFHQACLARSIGEEMGLEIPIVPPSMASEDFAFMLNKIPGAYIWLGAKKKGANPGLHSPSYDFNDEILAVGAEYWVNLAQRFLD